MGSRQIAGSVSFRTLRGVSIQIRSRLAVSCPLLAQRLLILLPVLVLGACTALVQLASASGWGKLRLSGEEIDPDEVARFSFLSEESFSKEALDMNVWGVRGVRPGPTLCLTAAVDARALSRPSTRRILE